ncbi:MAG: aminopeptidase [Nanoarchaeota archaeon]|nr:aminopeptidase [Nanoarchaeota archaeon]
MHSYKLLKWLQRKKFLSQVRINCIIFKKILQQNLNLKTEKVLIIGDFGQINKRISPIITGSYYLASKGLGLNTELIMQGIRHPSKNADDEVIHALKKLPVKNSAVIVNVSDKLGRFKSLGRSFRRFMKYKNNKFISTSGLGSLPTSKIFSIIRAYDINYKKLKEKQAHLKAKLNRTKEIKFITKAGTNVVFDIRGMKAISIDGDYRSRYKGGNLPAGEVYLPPRLNGVNGNLVIDGSSRILGNTILIKKPIVMDVRNGLVINIKGGMEAQLLKHTLRKAMQHSKFPMNVKRVSEIGIGFNPKASLVGAMVIDEKSLGTVHIALGSNYWFGGPVKSLIHLDQVMKHPKIYLDGKEYKMPTKKELK